MAIFTSDYSYMRNLVDTLIIIPRMIICKKLKKNELFTQTITIKNKGLVSIFACSSMYIVLIYKQYY